MSEIPRYRRYRDVGDTAISEIPLFRYLGKNGGLPREVSATEPSVMPRLRTPLEANRHSLFPEFKQTSANRQFWHPQLEQTESSKARLRTPLEANRNLANQS